MGWTTRRATPADAQRLSEIRVRSWQHAYRDILPAAGLTAMRPADGVARWIEHIGRPAPTAVFVAVGADDLPVAYSLVGAVRDDIDRHPGLPTCELWAIYSDPAALGSGAGHALHAVGLDHLAEQGFRHAVLWVFEDNAVAMRFYRAHGWVPDGGRDNFDWAGASVTEVRLSRSVGDQPSSV
jgi:ribosomal protein S18 acetylase RimI-like enzyme